MAAGGYRAAGADGGCPGAVGQQAKATMSETTLPGRRAGFNASAFIAEYGLLIGLLVMCIVFASLNPRFFTLANLTTLLKQNTPLLIVAVGMTFAIISRNIDLSPASVIALSGVALAMALQATGNIILAILAGFVVAISVEMVNAFLIVRMN